jgi:hypothetical protein
LEVRNEQDIHQFLDGNARQATYDITLFLVKRKALPTPLLCLSASFNFLRCRILVTGKLVWPFSILKRMELAPLEEYLPNFQFSGIK